MIRKIIKNIIAVLIICLVCVCIPIDVKNIVMICFENDAEWLSFMGSYVGGIIGGAGSLVGVYLTLKVSRKQGIQPYLVIDFSGKDVLVAEPEIYSNVTSFNGMLNYNYFPLVSEICDISIRNTGKGYAKDVHVEISLLKKEVLLTDKNLFFLSMCYLTEDKICEDDDRIKLNKNISYIGGEGECKILPINSVLNGMILSSIWNIAHFSDLDKNDFKKMGSSYYSKTKEKPMKVPDILIKLSYQDLDDGIYEKIFRIELEVICYRIGEGTVIRPRLYFENKYNKTRPLKKIKTEKLSKKEIKIRKELLAWEYDILEALIKIGVQGHLAEIISKDGAVKRFYFKLNEDYIITIEEVLMVFSFLFAMQGIKIELYNKRNISILKNVFLKYSNKNKINDVIRKEINKSLKDKEKLARYYFDLYQEYEEKDYVKICVCGDRNDFNTHIVKIKRNLYVESGFYRVGFTYNILDEREHVESVISSRYKNIEIGFIDYKAIEFGNDLRWECIYMN